MSSCLLGATHILHHPHLVHPSYAHPNRGALNRGPSGGTLSSCDVMNAPLCEKKRTTAATTTTKLKTLWAMVSEGFMDGHLTPLFLGCGEAGHHGKANYLTSWQPGNRWKRAKDSGCLSTMQSMPSNQTHFSIIPSYYKAIKILIH